MMRMRAVAANTAKRSHMHEEYASVPRSGLHPLSDYEENSRLYGYEDRSKKAFYLIEPVLKKIAQQQHQSDFVSIAQRMATEQLGFELPEEMISNTWISPLNMRSLYAWCVFKTYQRYADEFYCSAPLLKNEDEYQRFIEECGFHIMDVSPCADGRLAHIVRYVLRLPYQSVRRRSYAGAMFDVEDSLQKWQEVEFHRYREAKPNSVNEPTRYLKAAVYHYSESKPECEGCAAHGSNAERAAEEAMARLMGFQQAVENSFCCGASIDLLLIGIDTDSDAIRVHIPDAEGYVNLESYIDAREIYESTLHVQPDSGEREVFELVNQLAAAQGIEVPANMAKLIGRLLINNISQIDYVKSYFGGLYPDIGHHERFIGMGIGFEEVQLRNLTYFAYLKTVEEGQRDLDVGMKIFTGLNISRGLPAPVVIRYDFHGNVPGERERAVSHCKRLEQAMLDRFSVQAKDGLLHTLLVIRDCNTKESIEVVGGTLEIDVSEGAH